MVVFGETHAGKPQNEVNTDQLAAGLHITTRTVRNWVDAGMPVLRYEGRSPVFCLIAIHAWLEKLVHAQDPLVRKFELLEPWRFLKEADFYHVYPGLKILARSK